MGEKGITPQQVILMIYIMYGIIGFLMLILVLIIWKTPALVFLKSSMFKKPLMYVINKDHSANFYTFSPKNGAGHVRRVGIFNLTENSHTLEAGTKTPIYFAFRDLAATLSPEYPAIIQEIRESGLKINNIDDIKDYIEKIKDGVASDFPVKVHTFKTYRFHDLANMFPNNLDPTFIDSTIECEIAKSIKFTKMAPMAIGSIIALIIVGALAFYIMNMSFQGKITTKDCQALVGEATKNCVQQAIPKSTITTTDNKPVVAAPYYDTNFVYDPKRGGLSA